jgi:hypothetical protein
VDRFLAREHVVELGEVRPANARGLAGKPASEAGFRT